MAIKLKVPEGCGNVGLAGAEYTPDEHGCITIPDGVDYSSLLDHGLTIAPAIIEKAQGGQDDETQREELFNKAVEMGLKPHYKAGIPKLTEMIVEAEERAKAEEAEKAQGGQDDVAPGGNAPAGE